MSEQSPESAHLTREALADLLGEHRDDMEAGDYGEIVWSGCACGDEHRYDEHDLHIADVILARLSTPPGVDA